MLKNERIPLGEEMLEALLSTLFNLLRIPTVFPTVRINIREIFHYV